jgi:hypothetical protein
MEVGSKETDKYSNGSLVSKDERGNLGTFTKINIEIEIISSGLNHNSRIIKEHKDKTRKLRKDSKIKSLQQNE